MVSEAYAPNTYIDVPGHRQPPPPPAAAVCPLSCAHSIFSSARAGKPRAISMDVVSTSVRSAGSFARSTNSPHASHISSCVDVTSFSKFASDELSGSIPSSRYLLYIADSNSTLASSVGADRTRHFFSLSLHTAPFNTRCSITRRLSLFKATSRKRRCVCSFTLAFDLKDSSLLARICASEHA